MNSKKPVELSEKIDYLSEKISRVHWETKHSDDFELRLNFQEYIDNSINTLLSIKDRASRIDSPSRKVPDGSPVGKIYSAQKERLELDKRLMHFQMQQLQDKQMKLQSDGLHIKLLTKEKQLQSFMREADLKKRVLNQELEIRRGKCKFLEQQIENLIVLNKAQQEEIERERKERNRAEQKYLELRDKYQEELGVLEKFGEKTPKYLDRSTEGMKCTKYFTNVSKGDGKGTGQKLILLKLPVTLEANKIVYGITLGVPVGKKEVMYYDKFQLYEKETANISLEGGHLVVQYKKRRTNSKVTLDKYVVRNNEIVVQLFGKGDSIIVHQ